MAPVPTVTPGVAYLAVARGSDPRAITRAALAAIGGIERFVKSGDDVIVKPNICVDYHTYEYAATTNPRSSPRWSSCAWARAPSGCGSWTTPFGGSAESAYARSGIAEAVKAAGGEMEVMNPAKFRQTEIPEGRDITAWPVYQDVLTADVVINVPIAKHHSLARLTLGGKNLLGVIQDRSGIHANLGQRIADLVSLVRPTLTVVDAVRTLMAHGPTGGNLDDVRLTEHGHRQPRHRRRRRLCGDAVRADRRRHRLRPGRGRDGPGHAGPGCRSRSRRSRWGSGVSLKLSPRAWRRLRQGGAGPGAAALPGHFRLHQRPAPGALLDRPLFPARPAADADGVAGRPGAGGRRPRWPGSRCC